MAAADPGRCVACKTYFSPEAAKRGLRWEEGWVCIDKWMCKARQARWARIDVLTRRKSDN